MTARPHLQELTPTQAHDSLGEHTIILVDVREPQENVTERIHGARLFPLSAFDALAPPIGKRPVVLHCGSGKRSGVAVTKCMETGVPVTMPMKGGIFAWKHARFPASSLDPSTGAVVDRK